ncbi:CBS domain-containing protein [Sphaerimonospora thailandensis]|uniref:Oxidoreductase n=1 Tax=Sphaerimonospora thailandensis TaxID=795644 RepID=A0A8J3VX99_9ACTN|nr:CBS domain-containing protein [Sphaerimonospora thailandensis]GIH68237.1 oxidoreductase [Sphaerimonospora thailandensis]
MAQKVREVMTPAPVTVPSDASIVQAARLMREHNIGDVLVTEDDRLCGVITDRDIVVRAVADSRDLTATAVAAVCSSSGLATVTPDQDTTQALRLMRDKAIRRVPVVEEGRPVGVVSLGDVALERDPASALSDISAARPNT